MAVTVRHAFISSVPDDPAAAAAGQVTPSNWNAEHIVSGINGGSSGIVDVNSLLTSPLVGDGVTPNTSQLVELSYALTNVGIEMPVPVNITVGNPTVLSINPTVPSGGVNTNPTNHFLKPNQAFHFLLSAGGTLPSGISLGTQYYVTSKNLTAKTFTFSATNNARASVGEGPTVTTTGSLTGTLSIVLTGRDVNLLIPPGAYFCGNYADSVPNLDITSNGITRIRYFGYGAIFDTKTTFGTPMGSTGGYGTADTWDYSNITDYINTTPNELNQGIGFNAVITLVTTANATRYFVNQWISIFGLDIQDSLNNPSSGPPNLQYQEFKRIIAIDLVAGTLTLDGPLRWVYLSTFPHMFTPTSVFVAPGNASIVPMHPSWDTEIEIHGMRWVGEAGVGIARRFLFKDCVYQGYADYPAQVAMAGSQSTIYRNCRFGPAMEQDDLYMEVDKMMEYLELDGCEAYNRYRILFQSPSLQLCVIKNHQSGHIEGTPRNIKIVDSVFDGITVGPYLGLSDSVQIYSSRIAVFGMLGRNDDSISPGEDMTLLANWAFSGGTFTRNITGLTGQAMDWMVPGAKLYIADAGGTYGSNQNMGSPFAILNTYMDGSGNFSFDTTLTTIPTRQTSHTATITIATPGVVTWTAHGLAVGTAVYLTTTSVLPGGLSISTRYYVAASPAPTANTFSLTSTFGGGGTAIATSGTQSGVHTAFANPLRFRIHPCARFTSIGNSGCNTILDLNGAIDEPMFSRVKRSFAGKQDLFGAGGSQYKDYVGPPPNIWGNLSSDRFLTINVIRAGAGTFNVSCPGFDQPNLGSQPFSQTIDATQVGKRVITNTTATGSLGADVIAAYPHWIAGPLAFNWTGASAALVGSPLVVFEILTDQGITRFANMMGAPNVPGGHFTQLWQWADSGIVQQYGSLP